MKNKQTNKKKHSLSLSNTDSNNKNKNRFPMENLTNIVNAKNLRDVRN